MGPQTFTLPPAVAGFKPVSRVLLRQAMGKKAPQEYLKTRGFSHVISSWMDGVGWNLD